ncbi:MAG: hypothetical protein JJU45_16690 [Acidimicrobiia bacterium]|nr:hypothetical protein [Acidimicrobiia bacterium]
MTTLSSGSCESCGTDDVELTVVRRLYVTPEAWDTEGRIDEGDDERWCFVCLTHYPHAVVDDAAP